MITQSSKHYALLWFIIFINVVSLSQQVNSWEQLQPAERINDFHFSNTLTGWAVTNRNNILHTKNGGVHWQTIKSRSTSTSYSKVYCLDKDHVWVLNRNELSFTVNSGKTWTDISIKKQFTKLFDHLNPYNDSLDRTTMVAIVSDICFTTPQTGWASSMAN